MTLYIGSVAIKLSEVERAKEFWSATLGYVVRASDFEFVVLTDPNRRWANVSLQRWQEPKQGRSRLHLDLYSDNQLEEVERLEELGVVRQDWDYAPDADYLVMADPDGNEFCVIASPCTQS